MNTAEIMASVHKRNDEVMAFIRLPAIKQIEYARENPEDVMGMFWFVVGYSKIEER